MHDRKDFTTVKARHRVVLFDESFIRNKKNKADLKMKRDHPAVLHKYLDGSHHIILQWT